MKNLFRFNILNIKPNKFILLLFAVSSYFFCFPQIEQQSIDQVPDEPCCSNLTIFSKGKTFTYQAVLLSENMDTLSDETITLKTSGIPWYMDNKQTEVTYLFNFENTDTSVFLPITGSKIYWQEESITGAVEDSMFVWIHPIRSNQYEYTEVAPFPQIKRPFFIGQTWKKKLEIFGDWGIYNGTCISEFEISSKKDFQLASKNYDCWVVSAISKHNSVGSSKAEILFNEVLGFAQIDYEFYNKKRLKLYLLDIW